MAKKAENPAATIRILKSENAILKTRADNWEAGWTDTLNEKRQLSDNAEASRKERDEALGQLRSVQSDLDELRGWARRVREDATDFEIEPKKCSHEWRGIGDRVLCDKCGLVGEVPAATNEWGRSGYR